MNATLSSLSKGHRFPVETISHCAWLYHRFPLSLRDVEQMMAQRGVRVSYDTIQRNWSGDCGVITEPGSTGEIVV
jgi:transposase-like protein